jgi:hypothetical protein
MEKADGGWIDAEAAIAHVMRVTGKNRRQARAALVKAFRSGAVTTAAINPDTGEREVIPPDCWPSVN